jgi:NADH-quinone oxidoreductase subunit M
LPLVPLHSWLVFAHTEAPTFASIVLAGISLKTAVFGFLVFCVAVFPAVFIRCQPLTISLAIFSSVHAGFLAFRQSDFKLIVALSSIAHMGLVFASLFTLTSSSAGSAVLLSLARNFRAVFPACGFPLTPNFVAELLIFVSLPGYSLFAG